jgi:hypothetical protein
VTPLPGSPLEARLRRLQTTCGAMLLGVVALNVVALLLPWMRPERPASLPNVAVTALLVAGVVLLVAAPAVMRALYKRADAEGFGGDRGRALAAYAAATLAAFRLRALTALIGFGLAVATGDRGWSWGLGGAAAVAMLLGWPRRGEVGI